MDLFYADPARIRMDTIELDAFEMKHITQTLRKKAGDMIHVTDGQGQLYQAVIEQIKPTLLLSVQSRIRQAEPSIRIGLGMGFIRPNRLEFVLEKGTELGVTDFIFFRSRFSNYENLNRERFDKILRQALKQSQRVHLPRLQLYPALEAFIKFSAAFQNRWLAMDANSASLWQQLQKETVPGKSYLLVIGPEGGFSDEEIHTFEDNHFASVSLGRHRLRSETAALAGLAALQLFTHQIKEDDLDKG